MASKRKPYLIDWRFLPDNLLRRKDALRYALNVLGGDKYTSSAIGRVWFRFVRPGVVRSIASAGVMFIHIPRTGGSAISRSLYGKNLPHLSISYYRSLEDRRLDDLPSFAIIRDPFDRLVSAYRFLLAGGTQIVASSRFDPLDLRRSQSFDAFVETIASNPKLRYAYDVLRPQVDFICDANGCVLVDRLFLFHEFCQEISDLSRWVGGENLPRINETVAIPLTASASTKLLIRMLYNQDYTVFDRAQESALILEALPAAAEVVCYS